MKSPHNWHSPKYDMQCGEWGFKNFLCGFLLGILSILLIELVVK
jgi:hypothetical protein